MRIYLCPALMDWLVFLIFFAVLYGAGERQMSLKQCAWLSGIFPLVYMASSLLMGFCITRRNARYLLLSCLIPAGVVGAVCLMGRSFLTLMLAMGAESFLMAVFFNSFQTFMRVETSRGQLVRTVGFYTAAWSIGAALGFISSGLFYRLGPQVMAIFNGLVSLVIFIILFTFKPRVDAEMTAEEHTECFSEGKSSLMPVFVGVGWLLIFTVLFIQRPLHTFFSSFSARSGVSSLMASLPLFAHMLLQGIAALAMIRFRHVLYRRIPLCVFNICAALVMLCIWRWPSFPVVIIGISLLGIYTGYAYFSAVYYSSNSGRRSFNIGANEFLVGLGSFTGLFVTAWWMQRTQNDYGMYLVCGLAVLVSLAGQLFVSRLGALSKSQR